MEELNDFLTVTLPTWARDGLWIQVFGLQLLYDYSCIKLAFLIWTNFLKLIINTSILKSNQIKTYHPHHKSLQFKF